MVDSDVYEPKKFDSIEAQLESELSSIRDYMDCISLADESLPDEDYITFIKRLEKIQKVVNENATNKPELEKVNKKFEIAYKGIDEAREITKNNYEKAAQQKRTNGENMMAIRKADLDLAPKIIQLAYMIEMSDLFLMNKNS